MNEYNRITNSYYQPNYIMSSNKNNYPQVLNTPTILNYNYHTNNVISSLTDRDLNNLYYKELIKKKNRGKFDIAAPGNKNILIDSDSESHSILKKKGNKDNSDEYGCAKLIIGKVEKQAPKINEEYYKFTNQRRPYNTLANFYKKELKNFNSNNSPNNALTQRTSIKNINNSNEPKKFEYIKRSPFKDGTISHNYSKSNMNENKSYIKEIGNKNISNFRYSNEPNNFGKNTLGTKSIEPNRCTYYFQYPKKKRADDSNSNLSNSLNFFGSKTDRLDSGLFRDYNRFNLRKNRVIEPINSKINSFQNLTKKQIISKLSNFDYDRDETKEKSNLKDEQSAIKIQSYWRGSFIRDLMKYFWNSKQLVKILNKVIYNNNYIKLCFCNLIYYLKYKKEEKKPTREPKEKKPNNTLKSKIKNKLKEDDYNTLLKKYNDLQEEYNKLKNEKNPIFKH